MKSHKFHIVSRIRLLCLCIIFVLSFFASSIHTNATSENANDTAAIDITAKSALLMEANTGTIIYEKNAKEVLPPASVTKIMTLLLTFEALDVHKISPNDKVCISEHAASMGGSQVFLEPQEIQTVETLIKCVSIASANDGAVALAEHIAGSEEAFVAMMNQRAKELGMNHTNFVNCCGLDIDGHTTCAYDIALMSRELIMNHPQIYEYCKIWQEDITHVTAKGSKPFTLTNTNKLIKQYPYTTGLKTGSTSVAKFCISATASKDHMTYIAVIMAAETPKDRFKDATKLLDYGFATTSLYKDTAQNIKQKIAIRNGCTDSLSVTKENSFSYLNTTGENINQITRKIHLPTQLNAPVKKGDKVGYIAYYLNKKEIGKVSLLATKSVHKASFFKLYRKQINRYLPLKE